MVGDSVRLANLNAAKSAAINQLAQQRLTGATRDQMLVTQRHIAGLDKQINAMRVAKATMEEQRFAAQKLSGVLSGAAATAGALGTGLLLAGGIGAMGIGSLIKSAIDYQKQSSLTRTQVDKFAISLRDIEDIGIRVGRSIGVSFEQIQPALFDIFSSMEVGAKDAERLLKIFSKAAVAGQTDIASASRATIGILNAFQLPLSSINHLMDLQFQLVQEGVGTYEEWTQRIGLVSPSAARAGQSVDMMTAALAATTRMGMSAARSGTSVARAMDAMSNPKTVKALKALGVNALDAKGNFRPLIDVLEEFRAKLMKLPKAERIAKMLKVFLGAGGTIEARRFLQNMLLTPGNLEMFKTIFQEMSNESGSFEQAYAIMADSAATKSQLLANRWETVKIAAGEALIPAFLSVVNAIGKVFEWFNKLTPAQQGFIAKLLAVGVALAIVGGIFLIIVGGIAAFAAAVAVAGSGLLVFMGAITGIGLAIGLLGAGFIIAWKKSASFRKVVKSLGQALVVFYQKTILPAYQTLRDLAIKGFKFLSETIKSIAIPVIKEITKFYREHETTIKQIVDWTMKYGKWVLIVAGVLGMVLAAVIIGPVVGAFVAFIAIITAATAVIVLIVEAVKTLIGWLTTNVPKALNAVGSFFISIWTSIVNFLTGVWQRIVSIVMGGLSFLRGIWESFWSAFGGLIKAVWGLIVAVITLAFTLIWGIIKIWLNAIGTLWSLTWLGAKTVVTSVWNTITGTLIAVWNKIFAFAKFIWTMVSTFLSNKWNELRGTANKHFGGLFNIISAKMTDIWNRIVKIVSNIRDMFAGAGSWLLRAGQNIIQGLIDGITSKINDLTDRIKKITQKVKDFLPFSPAKVGPLSGRGSPFYSGQSISKMMSQGMLSKVGLIQKASAQISGSASTRGNIGIIGSGGSGGRDVVQNFTVNTQEISPRRHAAELGRLLAGRM